MQTKKLLEHAGTQACMLVGYLGPQGSWHIAKWASKAREDMTMQSRWVC